MKRRLRKAAKIELSSFCYSSKIISKIRSRRMRSFGEET
jgi:hypothetical protein